MAFPSSGGSVATLSEAWITARNIAGAIKAQTQAIRSACAAGNVGSSQVLGYSVFLADQRLRLAQVSSVPGLAAYVQTQIANPNIDIAVEFANMVTTLDNSIAWVVANFPQSGGFLAAQTINATGNVLDRQFTPAQTATFRTVLDTLIATIN